MSSMSLSSVPSPNGAIHIEMVCSMSTSFSRWAEGGAADWLSAARVLHLAAGLDVHEDPCRGLAAESCTNVP